MRINLTVEVPEGIYCEDCEHRTDAWCGLFNGALYKHIANDGGYTDRLVGWIKCVGCREALRAAAKTELECGTCKMLDAGGLLNITVYNSDEEFGDDYIILDQPAKWCPECGRKRNESAN